VAFLLGFNVETVEYKGVSFTTWDVSGRSGIVRELAFTEIPKCTL